jgi:hypothetical protein
VSLEILPVFRLAPGAVAHLKGHGLEGLVICSNRHCLRGPVSIDSMRFHAEL